MCVCVCLCVCVCVCVCLCVCHQLLLITRIPNNFSPFVPFLPHSLAPSAGAVEYTDCNFAEGK